MMPGEKGTTANESSTVTIMMAGAMMKTGFVRKRRNPVFLGENLDHVGHDLQQPERPHAVRTVAILPERKKPALHPDEQSREAERHDQDSEQSPRRGMDSSWRPRNPAPGRKLRSTRRSQACGDSGDSSQVTLARSSAADGALCRQDRSRPLHPVLPRGGSRHRQRLPRGREPAPVLRPPGLGDSVPRSQKCVRSERTSHSASRLANAAGIVVK